MEQREFLILTEKWSGDNENDLYDRFQLILVNYYTTYNLFMEIQGLKNE